MKKLTFILSLCTIVSAGNLYPMKRSLKSNASLKDLYVYTCTYQGCNKSFTIESSLHAHMHADHDLTRKNKTTLIIRNPKHINHIKETPITECQPKEHTNRESLITKINDTAITQIMNQEINSDAISEDSSEEAEEDSQKQK